MSLFTELLAAGIPVQSATETGEVSLLPGTMVTQEQNLQIYEITLNYLDPVSYARYLRIKARLANAKAEAALATELRTVTPAQAVDYIENNVTTLATAKAVLKVMARMLIAIRDHLWADLPE